MGFGMIEEEVKLYRRIKMFSVVILLIVVPLTLYSFIYSLTCTGSSCGIWFSIVLVFITIPSALFLHPLLFVMACYKITGSIGKPIRSGIAVYLMFTVVVIILIVLLLRFGVPPLPFLAISLISVLAWVVVSVIIPIYLLGERLDSNSNKKWLIISCFMPLIGLIKFRTIKYSK